MNPTRIIGSCVPTGVQFPIMAGPLKGLRWITGAAAGDAKGLSVIINKSEPRQLALARSWINKDSVCFDLGANVGFYTLLFARYGKLTYAFEPLPRNLSYLHCAIESNKFSNAVIVPWAVSDQMSLQNFAMGDNCALGRLGGGSQPAMTVSLDQFCDSYAVEPDLIKIDVEGAEASVISGGCSMLKRKKPKILLSVHSSDLRVECIRLLREIGYTSFDGMEHGEDGEPSSFGCSA